MGDDAVGPTPSNVGKNLRHPRLLKPRAARTRFFVRTLWFPHTGTLCRHDLPPNLPSRGCRSVSHRQIPSLRDAPRHSPPEPEHLPPRSPAEPSSREPPQPVWFGHQHVCFRHILHTLRCALDPRILWLQNHRRERPVPLFGFFQFNVPRAHHEHHRTPTSATGQLPASDDHYVCTLRSVSAASCRRLDQPAHP
jgi:hypothetical protein